MWSIRILFAIRCYTARARQRKIWTPCAMRRRAALKGVREWLNRKARNMDNSGNGLVLRFYYPGAGDYKLICMTMCDMLSIV